MHSFRNRLLLLILGLIAVTQTMTVFSVLTSTRRNVESRAQEQLAAGGEYVRQLVEFRAQELANGVAVLAADFGFREAVASSDAPTILSAASNHARRIRADLLMVLDVDGGLVAATDSVDPERLEGLTERVLIRPDMPHFAVLGGRLYQFFVASIRAPDVIGWAAMGFVVDDLLARRIADLVGVDVSFVVTDRGAIGNLASTLTASLRSHLAADLTPSSLVAQSPVQTNLAGEAFLAYVLEPEPGNEATRIVLSKPVRDTLAPYYEIRRAMLWLGGGSLLLAAVLAIFLGRSATQPVERLVRAARRIEGGRYDEAIAESGAVEFRRLAGTLNAMQRRVAEREAQITHQAFHDALTGLPNLLRAERDLTQMLALAPPDACVSVMVLDLGNLRNLNASLGHQVGDAVLRKLGERLVHLCHAQDRAARLGAGRFLLLLGRPHAPGEASRIGAAVLAALRVPHWVDSFEVEPLVTIGLSSSAVHGREPDQLIRRAEIALDEAEQSREAIRSYRIGSDDEHRRRLQLMSDLRHAIDANELQLVFQPKVAMQSRRVTGVEALLRWNSPQLGPVSPGEFVPLAEQTGNSRLLTGWVLRAAVRQMARWRREGLEIEVAVNLFAGDIVDPGLSDLVLGLLAEFRVPATSLALEITESAAMHDPVAAARNMEVLRVAGIRFSIDDFGTGYSSLSHLSRLPADEIKIDRSFVSNAHLSEDDANIVRSTIELGHNLNLKVTAEGVETAECWSLLKNSGCDLAQGFLISRPISAEAVGPFVREANAALEDADSTLVQVRSLAGLQRPR